MERSDNDDLRVFFELHESGLPRQAPGSEASTLRALDFVRDGLPDAPRILDAGCGPGASALTLAGALPRAQVLAVDLHPPFVGEAERRARKAGLQDRVEARVADMADPPVEQESLDLIWSEGALYFLGVEAGLKTWRGLLKPGGAVVFTDAVWRAPPVDRDPELAAFWTAYPGMADAAGVRAAIERAGYAPLGGFDLPEADWWAPYYTPLEARLDHLETAHPGAAPLAEARLEIALRRRFPDQYAYRFFAARLV